jgi:hypothetical protein
MIGGASPAIAPLLGASLIAHLTDLATRWGPYGATLGRGLLTKKSR